MKVEPDSEDRKNIFPEGIDVIRKVTGDSTLFNFELKRKA